MDFDEDRIYYSHQNLAAQRNDGANINAPDGAAGQAQAMLDLEDGDVDLGAVRRHFREFLRNYRQGARYLYRDRLLRMHRRTSGDDYAPQFASSGADPDTCIDVDIAHIGEYDTALLGLLLGQPAGVMPSFEMAAADALKTLLFDLRSAHNRTDDHGGDGGGLLGDDDGMGGTGAAAQGATQDGDEAAGEGTTANAADATPADEYSFEGTSIQILLRGNLTPTPLRSIQSKHMNTLLRCPGIVISASRVRSRAHTIKVRCSRCMDERIIHSTTGPFGGVAIPQRCQGPNPQECGPTPYGVVPDESQFVDQQTLKLQEAPESVPTGEMPRSILLAVERNLVDKAPPGTRVNVIGIASLFTNAAGGGGKGGSTNGSVRTMYLRVAGLQKDSGSGSSVTFTPREEEAFRLLSRRADVYDILSRSIAPSISGSYTVDIKRALACMLFGGSRKRLPDGMRLRGDINVLLLGDPSMAKSQFLKYTTRCAPVGVYTSGKGSSAAGLTASVVKDARGEFYLEGGAMVLADGGIVGIDEFDKMRPADRVAIHEAMEQQTISVAKAGITTVLNSRSSVLAAANPVFGRYDDLKSASENIDLMTTILSRFDLIFLVRDVRDEELDRTICRHVMGVHVNSTRADLGGNSLGSFMSSNAASVDGGGATGSDGMGDGGVSGGSARANYRANASTPEAIAEKTMRVATTGQGELDVPTMKKYVQYCRSKCSPRLTEEAGDVLASSYVRIRDEVRKRALESGDDGHDGDQAVIPITVRQLEALVRLSESLAKMRLEEEVQPEDVAEALRLFKVSTMNANASGQGSGGGASSVMSAAAPSRDEMMRTESFLRSRLSVGAVVNRQRILEEAAAQGYNSMVCARAISVMISRSEVQERNSGRLIKRVR